MKIVFFGTSEFSATMLKALVAQGHDIALVATLPDLPASRGHKPVPTPVKLFALSSGLEVFETDDMKSPAFAEKVASVNAELGVVVAFKILPKAVYNAPRLGTINVHPSLLPELRGPAPIQWALIRGYDKTGVTTFQLTDKTDAGDIILTKQIEIFPNETYGEFFPRIEKLSVEILRETLELYLKGSVTMQPQIGKNATSAPKITRDNSRIDWVRSALEVHNLVRGLSPLPSAWTTFCGEILRILETELTDVLGDPGCVCESDPKTGLTVACGLGAVKILQLQLSGKKILDAQSFLRGHPISIGEKFE